VAMTYFAQPPLSRHQKVLFNPTLDDMAPEDHAVRVFDDLVNKLDFS
jgi:hypothetical protein